MNNQPEFNVFSNEPSVPPRPGRGGKRAGAGRPAKSEFLREIDAIRAAGDRLLVQGQAMDRAVRQALAAIDAGEPETARRILRAAAYPQLQGDDHD